MTGSSTSGAPEAVDAAAGVGPAPGLDKRTQLLALAGLIILSFVLALPTLDNGFSLDDYNWLERASFRASNASFLLQPEPGQVFNPVGRGFFLFLFSLAGTNPLPYRLALLTIHALNVCLLYVLVERAFGRRDLAFTAAFLFAVERSYDEALFWIAAFFHPLNAMLCLAALLGFLVFLDSGSRVAKGLAFLALGAALLTKAPAFPFALLLPAALLVFDRGSSTRWKSLLPFAALWTVAVVANLVFLRIDQSYLVARGYYRFGTHIVRNLTEYLAWMAMPFSAAAEKLGAGELYGALVDVARVVVPIGTLVALLRARPRTTFFIGFGLVALVPFLPFTFEPVSRYTYLSAAGFAPAVAAAMLALGSRLGSRRAPRAVLALGLGTLLALLALGDTIVVDNIHEYRERTAQQLVADVQQAVPELRADRTIRIAGLPRFGIDRGIHLEAALRLAYQEPLLRLEIVPEGARTDDADWLRFDGGRIYSSSRP